MGEGVEVLLGYLLGGGWCCGVLCTGVAGFVMLS